MLLHFAAGSSLRRQIAELDTHDLQVDYCDPLDDAAFYALLPEATVLWHVLRPITEKDIAKARKLRLIQKIGVGVNTIDLIAAKQRNIAVCNMPGTNARAVAEMTLLLMLACLRRLPLLDRMTRNGRGWQLECSIQDSFGELGGRVVGLVGYGAIPQLLTPVLFGLGARVVYTATRPKASAVAEFRPLPELLCEADIVSLHLPLTPATNRLMDRRRLSLMKKGAILINTARGGLIDQSALNEALRNGCLSGAGLDVFVTEPVEEDEPLLELDNVVVVPHLAWLTNDTFERSLPMALENCRRLAASAPLLHRVV